MPAHLLEFTGSSLIQLLRVRKVALQRSFTGQRGFEVDFGGSQLLLQLLAFGQAGLDISDEAFDGLPLGLQSGLLLRSNHRNGGPLWWFLF